MLIVVCGLALARGPELGCLAGFAAGLGARRAGPARARPRRADLLRRGLLPRARRREAAPARARAQPAAGRARDRARAHRRGRHRVPAGQRRRARPRVRPRAGRGSRRQRAVRDPAARAPALRARRQGAAAAAVPCSRSAARRRMSQPPPDPSAAFRPHGRLRLRLGALGVAVVVLFVLLVLRLWALQVLNTRTFVAQAASNHEKQVIVRAPRGEILDDKGRVLVRNRVAYELDLDPGCGARQRAAPPAAAARGQHARPRAAPAVGARRPRAAHGPGRARHARDRHRRAAEVVPAGEPDDLPRALGRPGAAALLPVPHARRAHLRAALRDRAQAARRIRASTTTTAAT